MTENLLQKLEEKIMVLLSEIEELRDKVDYLLKENVALKTEHENFEKTLENKLKDLISLFDMSGANVIAENKPVNEEMAA